MHQLDHLITKKIRSTYGRRIFCILYFSGYYLVLYTDALTRPSACGLRSGADL